MLRSTSSRRWWRGGWTISILLVIASCSLVPRVQYSDDPIDTTGFTCEGFGISGESDGLTFLSSEEAALNYLDTESRGSGILGPEGGPTWSILNGRGTHIGYIKTTRLDGVQQWYVELTFECS